MKEKNVCNKKARERVLPPESHYKCKEAANIFHKARERRGKGRSGGEKEKEFQAPALAKLDNPLLSPFSSLVLSCVKKSNLPFPAIRNVVSSFFFTTFPVVVAGVRRKLFFSFEIDRQQQGHSKAAAFFFPSLLSYFQVFPGPFFIYISG